MAGKTNESIAHKVLPTNEANTPNSGTNEAITASPTTTIARLMHMQIFPGPVESLLFLRMILSFPSTISLIGCNMIGSVNASPTHNPTWHHTKCYIKYNTRFEDNRAMAWLFMQYEMVFCKLYYGSRHV